MKEPEQEKESNIYYQCQRCGNCCRWQGDVRITERETAVIADYLGIEVEDFIADYTRINANRTGLSIIDQDDGACIFLDGIDCRIQEVKPSQCKGFPNTWNFPGWRDHCEAIPVERPKGAQERG